jgi:hypothetical protein
MSSSETSRDLAVRSLTSFPLELSHAHARKQVLHGQTARTLQRLRVEEAALPCLLERGLHIRIRDDDVPLPGLLASPFILDHRIHHRRLELPVILAPPVELLLSGRPPAGLTLRLPLLELSAGGTVPRVAARGVGAAEAGQDALELSLGDDPVADPGDGVVRRAVVVVPATGREADGEQPREAKQRERQPRRPVSRRTGGRSLAQSVAIHRVHGSASRTLVNPARGRTGVIVHARVFKR